jgi:hypothetical protein
MYCPKCGTENQDDARSCSSCGLDLKDTSRSPKEPDTKTSGLALAALYLGIFSIPAFFLIKVLAFSAGISAIILGIVALIKIKQSSGRLKGRGLAITGIVIPAVLILIFGRTFNIVKPPSHRFIYQLNQFHSITIALEMFRAEFDSYPDSGPTDTVTPPQPYCGAMKLAEAMLGQDLLGFHPDSIFRSDGQDGFDRDLYPVKPTEDNLKARKEPYLALENANAYKLKDIFPNIGTTAPNFNGDRFVLCDVYTRATNLSTGRRIGMPILYYKADTSKTAHNIDNPDDPNNIYNYRDNYALLGLGAPWDPNVKHPLFTNPKIFYEMTKDYKATEQSRPYRADSFILISAGFDGMYGTKDDIFNFGRD